MQVWNYASMQVCTYMHVCKYACMQVLHIYASMRVCKFSIMKFTSMQLYPCLYKKFNKKKDRARSYPRLRDFCIWVGKTFFGLYKVGAVQ